MVSNKILVASIIATCAAAVSLPAQNRVSVSGVAYDSLHSRPLAGAFVSIIGTNLSSSTDSAGRFTIENVAPGTYRIVAQHDVIDALGMSAIGATANITDGRQTVRLFVPSFGQLWKVVCGPTPPSASDTGFVFGNVRPAPGMKHLANVAVSATWVDLVASGKTVGQKLKTLETTADSTGNFTLCGVPTSTGLAIRAASDSAETGWYAIDPMDKERIARRDVRLGTPLANVVAAKRGAKLTGRVQADSGGGLISNADVLLEETGATTKTNEKGEFTLTDIIPGTQTLHVKRIGFAEAVTRVDFEEAESVDRTIVMNKVTVLDSVGVTAAAVPREEAMRGFEEHRKLGLGKFLTREDLAKAGERPLASILQQFNGLQVIRTRDGKSLLFARRGTKSLQGNQNCAVAVYLDGIPYSPGTPPDINDFDPKDLEAVEYFSGAGRIPAEYNRLGSACGVLVVHSRYKK